MGYKVYYGYISPGENGHMDHYIWTSRTLIYDTGNPDDSHYLIEPVLTMNANEAGSFEADVPHTNVCWDDFRLMLGMVEIEEDGDIIWQGRITQINTDFNLNRHIYCEGELSFLNDCAIAIDWSSYRGISILSGTYGYYPFNYFSEQIHSVIANEGKYIYNGMTDRANSLDPADSAFEQRGGSIIEASTCDTNITADDTVYKSAWEGLTSDLLDGMLSKFSGYAFVKLTREHDSYGYRRVIDLMVLAPDEYRDVYGDLLFGRGLDEVTTQTIEFGKNLMDIDIESGLQDDLVTVAYAFGYQTKGWWIFKNTEPISGIYTDSEGVGKYGTIQKMFSIDGESSTYASLVQAATDSVSTKSSAEYLSVKVKAVDLYDAGEAPDHLRFMKFTNIISEPHGINRRMLCTGCTIPLDKPDQKEFSYGSNVKRFTKLQNITTSVADKSYDMSRTTMNYVTTT